MDLVESILSDRFGDTKVEKVATLQNLWSGYGSIVRYRLEDAKVDSVIVKHVAPPGSGDHPRGWNTDLSHQRKLRSYEVEAEWYRSFAARCESGCRVPKCYAVESAGSELLLILEDLDVAGFSLRKSVVGEQELFTCVHWLAEFHATFLNCEPFGLWESGTYWHLETRPDELEVLSKEDPKLWAVAGAIDAGLKNARFQTLVHGDAKLANFCFSETRDRVAAVDFQYVGRGCGMKDLAYFVGSCLREEECAEVEEVILDYYFNALELALDRSNGDQFVFAELEEEWRGLYPVAWADFHRFLKGWSPGHWKINSYSERVTLAVIDDLMPTNG